MTTHRISKINELLRQHLAEIIERELSLKPGVLLTIAKVDTSRDLRYTRVFVSVFPEQELNYGLETLRKEAYTIQGKLNKLLSMKPLPRVEFFSDTTEVRASEVEVLLAQIKNEQAH